MPQHADKESANLYESKPGRPRARDRTRQSHQILRTGDDADRVAGQAYASGITPRLGEQIENKNNSAKDKHENDAPYEQNEMDAGAAHVMISSSESEEAAEELTREDYLALLETHEEIEDMSCPICLERMDLGQIIIRTRCGLTSSDAQSLAPFSVNQTEQQEFRDTRTTRFQQVLPHAGAGTNLPALSQFDMASIGRVAADMDKGLATHRSGRAGHQSLLKGHKFHVDCFKSWLEMGKTQFYRDNTVFYQCPMCRRDMLKYEDDFQDADVMTVE